MLIVALPCYAGDVELLLKNLRWQASLCGQQPGMAVLSCDPRFDNNIRIKLELTAQKAFKTVKLYSYPHSSRQGWPQGPNWVFQNTARYMEQFGSPWLFLEPDAVPIRVAWLSELDREYAQCGKRFMGVIVPDWGHMNGVGVYPPDTPRRIPQAMNAVDTAWDTAMKPEMIWDCHRMNHLCLHAWGVVNSQITAWDGVPPKWSTQESLRSIPASACLVHRDKALTIPDRLREQRNGARLEICNMKHARTDIFIVSYAHDLVWLEYCIKSIRKFCTGFGQVNVLVPTNERRLFEPLAAKYHFSLADYQTPADKEKHHLAHQLEKCHADRWCPDADAICFVDSDCVFTEPVTPEEYFVDGKPVLLIRPYALSGGGIQWKEGADRALGLDTQFETMARHPACHLRGIFKDLRERVESVHRVSFDDYVLSCKPTYPWGFSEFVTIGNWMLLSKWRQEYHVINLATEPRPKDKLFQAWSHSPIDVEQTFPSTGERGIPKELFEKAGL